MSRYIGKQPAIGNFVKLDSISVVNGQAAYTMQSGSVNFTPESANHMLVSLNGLIQNPGSSFTVSGSTITFSSNLVTGDVIDFIMVYGNVLDIGTPSDDTISASKLKTNSVITAKIQDDAVTKAKVNFISDGTAGVEVKGDGGSNDGYIQLNCSQNSHGVKIKSPPHSAGQSYTLTLPQSITNDYYLKTDGSGNLSFAQVSSDFVKLNESTASNVATHSIDGFFSSDYDNYILYGNNLQPATSGDLRMRFQQGGSANSSSEYVYATGLSYTDISPTHLWQKQDGAYSDWDNPDNVVNFGSDDHNNTATHAGQFILHIYNPLGTTNWKIFDMDWKYNYSNNWNRLFSAGMLKNTSALSGVQFFYHSGNINGSFKLYGLK